MAAISAQRALDLANETARNRERTMNAFTGNNVRALTKLQSMYRRNKEMSRYKDLRRNRAATRIQALQRARSFRKGFKDRKYYERFLSTGKGIYKRGLLVRCIDPNNTQFGKYGHIERVASLELITEDVDELYDVMFIGANSFRMRRNQIRPVFLFDSTSIPEDDFIASMSDGSLDSNRTRVISDYEEELRFLMSDDSSDSDSF